jgi:putative two-component system response regulator
MDTTRDVTVLVIDDDAVLAQTMHDFLALEGIRVVTTRDLDAYVQIASEVAPDVVVIDLMLAAQSGIEVAAELRQAPVADVPFIAISSSPFLLEIAVESDLFAHVLAKPIDLEQLLILIMESVDTPAGATER